MTILADLCAAALLITAVLTVWRRSQRGVVRVIAAQGVVLAVLVAVVAAGRQDWSDLLVIALVLGLKGILLPALLARRLGSLADPETEVIEQEAPLLNPTATLVLSALLAVAAYAVISPLFTTASLARLTPVGVTMILIGLVAMATRRQAIAQLVGFLLLDNGIAAVAFFSSGGVPVLIEFASSFDLLLVVVILQVFAVRLHRVFGDTDVRRLRELRD